MEGKDGDRDSGARGAREEGEDRSRDQQAREDRARDERDWVDVAARWAGHLGMNPVRIRWKLDRMRRRARGEGDGGRAADDRLLSTSTLLGALIVAVYLRVVAASGGHVMSIPIGALVYFGGNLPVGMDAGQWWRVATSIFLHAGLWHIGFNLIALAIVGPAVEDIYGRWRMVFLFMVTGIAAAIGSRLLGLDGVGIGASGAIMGLVGVAAGWGQRQGTRYGQELRNRMLTWAVYTVIFGFFVGADNRAHVVGLVVGAAFGYGVRPVWLRHGTGRTLARIAAIAGVAAALLTTAAALFPPPWS